MRDAVLYAMKGIICEDLISNNSLEVAIRFL